MGVLGRAGVPWPDNGCSVAPSTLVVLGTSRMFRRHGDASGVRSEDLGTDSSMMKGFRVLGRPFPGPEGRAQVSLARGKPVARAKFGSEDDRSGVGGVPGNLKFPRGWPLIAGRRQVPKFSEVARKPQLGATGPRPGKLDRIVIKLWPSDLTGECLLSASNLCGVGRPELSASVLNAASQTGERCTEWQRVNSLRVGVAPLGGGRGPSLPGARC